MNPHMVSYSLLARNILGTHETTNRVCRWFICIWRVSECSWSSSLARWSFRTVLVEASSSSWAPATSRFSSSIRARRRRTSASECSARRNPWLNSTDLSCNAFFNLLCACRTSSSSLVFSSSDACTDWAISNSPRTPPLPPPSNPQPHAEPPIPRPHVFRFSRRSCWPK